MLITTMKTKIMLPIKKTTYDTTVKYILSMPWSLTLIACDYYEASAIFF